MIATAYEIDHALSLNPIDPEAAVQALDDPARRPGGEARLLPVVPAS